MAVKELTAPELAILRAGGRFSIWKLAIHGTPATVFACRVNQTFDTLDGVADVIFDGVTVGAYTDVLPGMTCYVGSAAGLYDLGMVRVRAAFTSTVAKFGMTSEIPWANDLYLTVVDEFGLWTKPATQTGNVVQVDYDTAFSTATHLGPVACAGPMAAVLRLTGATVAFHPTDVGSWSPLGLSITARLWSAPGASGTSGMTGSTPTITYNAAGVYRVSLRVTDSSGATHTTYRWVFVEPESPEFAIERGGGDMGASGWSFSVVCYSGVTREEVRDRALCVLWSRDFYETSEGSVEHSEGSVGPLADCENIEAIGWIDGSSIDWDAADGSVRFTVGGPASWLQKMEGGGATLRDTGGTATKWEEIPSLTADRALYHLLRWRSTAAEVMDCFTPGDTNRVKTLVAPVGTLWEQIRALSENVNLATPLVDRYGSLWIEWPAWLLPIADRSGIVTAQALTKQDLAGKIQIPERRIVPQAGMIELVGTGPYSGSGSPAILAARAPGNTPKRFGGLEAPSGTQVFTNQADAITKAKMLLGWRNNEFPAVIVSLPPGHRGFDIAPRQRATLSIEAGDTPLGITWTDQDLLPQRISLAREQKGGAGNVEVEFAAETTGEQAAAYTPPQPPSVTTPPITPPVVDIPPIVIGPPTIPPPSVPPPPGNTGECSGADLDTPGETFFLTWDKNVLDATGSYEGRHAYAWFPVSLRPSSATFPTVFGMQWTCAGTENFDTVWDHLHVYAVDGAGARLLTATPTSSPYVWSLTTVSALPVAGFEVELDALDDVEFSLVKGAGIVVGGPNEVDSDGDLLSAAAGGLIPGNFYWVEYHTAAWREQIGGANRTDIEFGLDGVWSGHLGWNGSAMFLILTPPVFAQGGNSGIDWGHYVFQYPDDSPEFRQRVYSTSFGDNIGVDGGMLTELFHATISGQRIVYLGETYIQSPCGTT